MRKAFYILLLVLSPLFWRGVGGEAFAQNKTDSLLALLKTDKEDTNKVKHLNSICREFINVGEYDKGLIYGKQALVLVQNITSHPSDVSWKRDMANSYNSLGLIYMYQGNYPEALKNYFSSLKTQEEIKDKKGIASLYNNIGNVYANQNNYSEALKMYIASLKICEELKVKRGIAISYNNIGNIYHYQGNIQPNFSKKEEFYNEALKNYFASLKIKEEMGNTEGIAGSYINLGGLYTELNKTKEAQDYLNKALTLNKEIGSKDGISTCYINLGTLYIKLNKTKEAQDYLNKALDLSKEIGSNDNLKETYAELTVLDSLTGNYKAAFEHRKLYILYRDSLENEETKKKSLQASMQYEFDKKEIAAKAEQDKLDVINAEEKKKQQIVIYAVAGLLVLVAVFAIFMFNRFRITNRQKHIIELQKQKVDEAYTQLEEKNKEVMDSIRYAKRIQTALITSEKYIANSLNRLMKNS